MQDNYPIRQSQYFRQLRRYQNNRETTLCQPIYLRIDFLFCADVDAARRLIHNQDIALTREPFGQGDLLLVAAAQAGDKRVE